MKWYGFGTKPIQSKWGQNISTSSLNVFGNFGVAFPLSKE